MKKILLTLMLALTCSAFGQVPSYVPTNGLVGWWPFNGNANDESGNNNNGTVNGATLSPDRFGNANKAYSFNGTTNYIMVNNTLLPNTYSSFTWSFWIKTSYTPPSNKNSTIISDRGTAWPYKYNLVVRPTGKFSLGSHNGGSVGDGIETTNGVANNVWKNIVVTLNSATNVMNCYINGVLDTTKLNYNSGAWSSLSNPTYIGVFRGPAGYDYDSWYNGLIDDIGLWNRALTPTEVAALYNNCNLNAVTNNASAPVGANAQFTATSSDPNATFAWQNNPLNNGWQNVPNNASYAGVTTNMLTVNNVQIGNHMQPFRVIATSGTCKDTSDVVMLSVNDTCIISVSDTLFIDATLTGVNPPNNLNTLKVYPNPAKTHITIDNGNYTAMAGYTVKIENTLGQTVFTSPVTQQTFFIDISTWSGNGIYTLTLLDGANGIVSTKKIVIQ